MNIYILFEIVQKAFVDCLYYATELFWRKKCRIVYSGKVICYKDAPEEGVPFAGECRNVICKIWFVPFAPWLPSSMSNHDGKWVFYYYHICFSICTRFEWEIVYMIQDLSNLIIQQENLLWPPCWELQAQHHRRQVTLWPSNQ